jgi:hypothetical protein
MSWRTMICHSTALFFSASAMAAALLEGSSMGNLVFLWQLQVKDLVGYRGAQISWAHQ